MYDKIKRAKTSYALYKRRKFLKQDITEATIFLDNKTHALYYY